MKEKRKSAIGYLLQTSGKYKLHIVLSGIFSVLSALCTFVPFIMVYRVLLLLLTENIDTLLVIRYGMIAGVSIIGKFLFSVISGTFSHVGAFNTLYNVRMSISKHIANIDLGFFTDNASGKIKKIMIEDVERIEKFLAHQIPDMVSALCVPIIVFVYLVTLSVPMALSLLIPMILGIIVQMVVMAMTGRDMNTYHSLLARMNSTIMQFINGMPVMKTYNMTAKSYKEYSETVTEYNTYWKRSAKTQGYSYGVFVALVESGILFALPIGGYLFLKGTLSAGNYLFFMIMSIIFLSSFLKLLSFGVMYNQIMSGVSRVQDIMEIPTVTEGENTLDVKKSHNLSFCNVSFQYDTVDILKHISIDIPAGSLTAFVGASGAGKTTAAQLIPKFWTVKEGEIVIDGKNINTLQTDNLMNLVSFVFQETFMLNESVYQNIAIGNKAATTQQVEDAAKAAQIHDFIMSLPEQYNTTLGEDGVKMSGGEKQRICIARAILKDAPIIIFDEATSFTDIESEHKIQLALNHLLKNKTTIMIAHRLHTIKNANQICVFQNGEIVEKGTHQDLVRQEGLYHHMWNTYSVREKEVQL